MASKTTITPQQVAVAVAIGAAVVLAYTATRSVGPVATGTGPQNPLTELEGPVSDFQEHLAHASELLTQPVMLPHRYPARTAPGTTRTMHQGFAPLYALPDPQIAALPTEKPW